ncbi:unnamed protein product, partial [Laminaria digitata]
TFIGNAADYHGGAIYALGPDSFHISNATFGWNEAQLGGAVVVGLSEGKTSELRNCIFDGNQASEGGAAFLYTGAGADIFTSSVFSHNFA